MEERLDKILVSKKLVETRVIAEKLIQEIGVKVNGKLITKPGKKFAIDCKIELITEELPWISIDSIKLAEAIKKWKLKIDKGIFLDVNSATGSFTEVLLKNKASKIYSFDSTRDSLDHRIKGNEQIIDFTGKHLRELTVSNVPELLDGAVINESNISMNKIFPFIHPFLKQEAFVVALIKPQFEVEKESLKNNGFVRNTLAYPEMFETLKKVGETNNLKYLDHIDSPIIGKDGQQEFIMLFQKV
jgi:23S rRNA (cytidine1920-2'-O)/16S rRNA (cytidine1409-2'-O)-methyltransferase